MNFIASIATVATGPSRPARGDDAGGDVHLAQHPAAEDVAVGVDVGRPRHHPQDRRAFESVIPSSFRSLAAGLIVMAARLLRKTRVISAGSDQHGEPDAERGRDHQVDVDRRRRPRVDQQRPRSPRSTIDISAQQLGTIRQKRAHQSTGAGAAAGSGWGMASLWPPRMGLSSAECDSSPIGRRRP